MLFAVGFFFHIMNVYIKVKMKVAQLYPTVCDPMDFTVHGIL